MSTSGDSSPEFQVIGTHFHWILDPPRAEYRDQLLSAAFVQVPDPDIPLDVADPFV